MVICIFFLYTKVNNRCIWDIRTQRLLTKLKSPCGCGYVLDCCYSRETGELYSGYRNGDIAIWGN